MDMTPQSVNTSFIKRYLLRLGSFAAAVIPMWMIKEVSRMLGSIKRSTPPPFPVIEPIITCSANGQADRSPDVASPTEEVMPKTSEPAGDSLVAAEETGTATEPVTVAMAAAEDALIAKGSMKVLINNSVKAGTALSLIDVIAAQSEQISIDAAFDTLRGGKPQGHFAVVADKLRKVEGLNETTIKEVIAAIHTIQKESVKVAEAVLDETRMIGNGVDLDGVDGNALREILTEAKGISEMIEQIVISSRKQGALAAEIAKKMPTAAGEVKVGAIAIDRFKIARMNYKLTRIAEKLRKFILKFQRDDECAAPKFKVVSGGRGPGGFRQIP